MRVFKTKWFRRFARREGIADAMRWRAQAGGYRTLIVYRARDRAIFVFGFAKNEREDLEPDELEDLKTTAKLLLASQESNWTRHL